MENEVFLVRCPCCKKPVDENFKSSRPFKNNSINYDYDIMNENLINKQFLRSGFKIIFNCCIYISVLFTSNEFNFNIVFFEIGVILSSIREIIMMRYLYLNLQQLKNDIDNNSAIDNILNYLFIFKLLNCLYLYILIIFQNIDKDIDSRILFIFYTSEVLFMFENREKSIISSNNTIENINNYNINDTTTGEPQWAYTTHTSHKVASETCANNRNKKS